MKIIDLLNKIANDDIPKEIEYDGFLFSWDRTDEEYFSDEKYGDLFSYLFSNKRTTEVLNEEIEIIEEDKKIEKLRKETVNIKDDKALALHLHDITKKIDEIINYINEGDK